MQTMTLIASIDQGTTSSRVIIFNKHGTRRSAAASNSECRGDCVPGIAGAPADLPEARVGGKCPGGGTQRCSWTEHDPSEIVSCVVECLDDCYGKLKRKLHAAPVISCVGVTNQRETIVCWNPSTGHVLHNAIVWLDTRNHGIVSKLSEQHSQDGIRDKCGLPFATYFSATKVRLHWCGGCVEDALAD